MEWVDGAGKIEAGTAATVKEKALRLASVQVAGQ